MSAAVRFMKTSEVADLCKVDPKTVIKWIANGDIKFFRLPRGHFRFHRDDVQQFMRDHGFLRAWEKLPDETKRP